jgi:hypothetical protein
LSGLFFAKKSKKLSQTENYSNTLPKKDLKNVVINARLFFYFFGNYDAFFA